MPGALFLFGESVCLLLCGRAWEDNAIASPYGADTYHGIEENIQTCKHNIIGMVEVKCIKREGGECGETAEEAGSKQAVSHRERFFAAFHGALQQAHEKTAEHVDAEDAKREGHGQAAHDRGIQLEAADRPRRTAAQDGNGVFDIRHTFPLVEHQEKAESGSTKAQDHIDDDIGNGLSGLSVTEGGERIHRECGECGQRAEKAFANEVMPRDKGNGIHLDCPCKQPHNKRTEHVYE